MPWQSLPPKLTSAQTATLNKDGISLSGKFVENQNLMEYEWVELFIDDTLRRIGFKFHYTPTEKTRKLTKPSKKGRMIYARDLQGRKWISDVLDEPLKDRRFLIGIDDSLEEPTKGVRYYIFVGYRFQPTRDFKKQGDYPRMAGVYRLFKDGEVIRIGESDNLERRLKEHFKDYRDGVEEYDFAEIPDSAARRREERRLLEEFRDAYGRLPKLNPVAT